MAKKKPLTPVEQTGDSYEKARAIEAKAHATAVTRVKSALKGVSGSDRESVLARVIADDRCPSLFVEWLVDHMWAIKVRDALPLINRIYDELVRREIRQTSEFRFNDLDDAVWFEPHDTRKVFAHTTQSRNYLYIWEKSDDQLADIGHRRLHVRRFYDRFDDYYDPKDEFNKKDEAAFKQAVRKGGRAAALRLLPTTTEFADDGVAFPKRYSLDSFREQGFSLRYGDARDAGYVLSWQEDMHSRPWDAGRVHNAVTRHSEIEHILDIYLPNLEVCLPDIDAVMLEGGE